MTWTLTLPYKSIPKGLSGNYHGHWRTRHTSTREVRDLVVMLARTARIPQMQRMQVELVQYVTDNRVRDADNAWPLLKAGADALASNRGASAHSVPADTDANGRKTATRNEHGEGARERKEDGRGKRGRNREKPGGD